MARFLRSTISTAQVSTEYLIPGPLRPGRAQCIADIRAAHDNTTFFLDITVTSQTCPSVISRVPSSSSVELAAATHAEVKKIALYRGSFVEPHGDAVVDQLVPFALETSGRLGAREQAFLDMWCARALGPEPSEDLKTKVREQRFFMMKRIATLLVKGNYRIIQAVRGHLEVVQQPQQ